MTNFKINFIVLSKEEIKYEINHLLDQLSDKALAEVLALLKKVEQPNNICITDSAALQKILAEDKDLLHKLAQ